MDEVRHVLGSHGLFAPWSADRRHQAEASSPCPILLGVGREHVALARAPDDLHRYAWLVREAGAIQAHGLQSDARVIGPCLERMRWQVDDGVPAPRHVEGEHPDPTRLPIFAGRSCSLLHDTAGRLRRPPAPRLGRTTFPVRHRAATTPTAPASPRSLQPSPARSQSPGNIVSSSDHATVVLGWQQACSAIAVDQGVVERDVRTASRNQLGTGHGSKDGAGPRLAFSAANNTGSG